MEHANSLRALICVVYEVKKDAAALISLKKLKIPSCVLMVLRYHVPADDVDENKVVV